MEYKVMTYTVENGLETKFVTRSCLNDYDPECFDLHYNSVSKVLYFIKNKTFYEENGNIPGLGTQTIPMLEKMFENVGTYMTLQDLWCPYDGHAINYALINVRINALRKLFKDDNCFHAELFLMCNTYPTSFMWNPEKSFCFITEA
ncbi:MAG: hypothetical protein JEZ07_15030 [Phycisphaerae bacterium]|nr:hypothetical protein [Phycisphaerae bacterium]